MDKAAAHPPSRSASAWVGKRLQLASSVLLIWGVATLAIIVDRPLLPSEFPVGEVAHRNVYAPHEFLDTSTTPPRTVKRGQRLLQQGDVVTPEQAALLGTLRATHPLARDLKHTFGAGLIVGLFLALGWALLRTLDPRTAKRPRLLWLVGLVFAGTLLVAKALLWAGWPILAIPMSLAAMLVTMLLGAPAAVTLTLCLVPLLGLLAGGGLVLVGVLVVAALAGSLMVRTARHRGQLLRAGAWVGVLHVTGLGTLTLVGGHIVSTTDLIWGVGNGIASSLIVMGLLPVFEHVFQVTTAIRLLELADLNHPVLKELVLKAPGTYHHSLIVGNLAEAACEAIGANALLARVGSYFHDIGKMEQAEYFIENQAGGDYLHDKLTPAMSGLVITNHVRRGIALAKKAQLPQAIIDFIPQHHGTGLVFYFYHKAMEKYDEAELAEADFRYEGPKPQSRETAAVLLADGIEASCRALVEPTPARIRGLVRKIINARFIDGQLDECDLTLRDLTNIEEVFTRVLLGIHHTRIQYPETEEDADSSQEPAAGAAHPATARHEARRAHS